MPFNIWDSEKLGREHTAAINPQVARLEGVWVAEREVWNLEVLTRLLIRT